MTRLWRREGAKPFLCHMNKWQVSRSFCASNEEPFTGIDVGDGRLIPSKSAILNSTTAESLGFGKRALPFELGRQRQEQEQQEQEEEQEREPQQQQPQQQIKKLPASSSSVVASNQEKAASEVDVATQGTSTVAQSGAMHDPAPAGSKAVSSIKDEICPSHDKQICSSSPSAAECASLFSSASLPWPTTYQAADLPVFTSQAFVEKALGSFAPLPLSIPGSQAFVQPSPIIPNWDATYALWPISSIPIDTTIMPFTSEAFSTEAAAEAAAAAAAAVAAAAAAASVSATAAGSETLSACPLPTFGSFGLGNFMPGC